MPVRCLNRWHVFMWYSWCRRLREQNWKEKEANSRSFHFVEWCIWNLLLLYVKPVLPLVVVLKTIPAVIWKSTTDRDSWKMGEACSAFQSCETGNHSVWCHDRFIGCVHVHVQAEDRCQHLTAHLPHTGTIYFLCSDLKNTLLTRQHWIRQGYVKFCHN